eukprot:TRINITY_DN16062_c0_g1_i1.p1 TRINITY_DN16062_c0_g1~~TRINITY_DN16062_c0_g1_i1.p1  ORF type:complete len:330 (+),score=47.99 TRINITY_DN16062_c0_g1_i1:48-1037(+)
MPTVVVVGAGVVGLTTGVRLLDAGYRVTIVAEEFTPNTTSDKAGAIWYPFRSAPADKVAQWSRATYLQLQERCGNAAAGVAMVEAFISGLPQSDLKDALPYPTRQLRPARAAECPRGVSAGTVVTLPFCDTPVYMTWLMSECARRGGVFEKRTVTSLAEECGKADVVVNCTGYGAKSLVGDSEMTGISGHIAIVDARASAPPPRYSIIVHGEEGDRPVYIFPRPASGQCIVGGTTDAGGESKAVSPSAVADILSRATAACPGIAAMPLVKSYVGVRPYRTAVRLEREPGTNLIHNYGHGGSGYTIADGCADDAVKLVQEYFKHRSAARL